MKTVVCTEAKTLKEHAKSLQDIARALAEPNVFYEDWMLIPALELLRKDERVEIVLIFEPSGERLMGVFPLELRSKYKKLPIRHYRMWQHKHCFLCTPLIRKGTEREAISAFYEWLRAQGRAGLMVWNWIGGDGPIAPAILERAVTTAAAYSEERFERAVLPVGKEAEPYLSTVLSGGHLRDLRRLERRLSESGEFAYEALNPGDPAATPARIDAWIADFLEVESSGWKGRSQTAMKCSPEDLAFFTACVKGAHERGKLSTVEARVDGKPIASRCNFTSGNTAFSFKIAFDEKFSKSRPGLLLEVEHIRRVFSTSLEKVDYCADPGHPMIDRLSTLRKPIVTISTAQRLLPEGLVLKLAPWAAKIAGARRVAASRAPAPSQPSNERDSERP